MVGTPNIVPEYLKKISFLKINKFVSATEMSLLRRIENKGCVLEWSPIALQPNLVALGTKDSAGAGFDDYGGDLEIHRLDFSNKNSSTILGSVKTQ